VSLQFTRQLADGRCSRRRGDGFGWVSRALVFAPGLLPAVFVDTCVAHWILRRRGRNRARQTAAL
jgi:hypothetical protein